MSFEIHNPTGNKISLSELNKEAAELWQVEYSPDYYMHPGLKSHWTNSWYETIVWTINNPESTSSNWKGWDNIKASLWIVQAAKLFTMLLEGTTTHTNSRLQKEIESIREFLEPYYKLIDHWESKGYVLVEIKD